MWKDKQNSCLIANTITFKLCKEKPSSLSSSAQEASENMVIYTKLQLCHCEEPFGCAQGDVAIYPIEPALVRVAGNRLSALQYFGNGSLKNQAWQISLPWRDLAATL